MIALVHGTLVSRNPTDVVVECGGVGYAVNISLSTYDKLPEMGKDVTLLTVMTVREDDISLYGFATTQEKQLFLLLTTVKGIGAKTALNILSSLNIDSFCQSVRNADIKSLKKISGVGPKSAERIVVELRDKVSSIMPSAALTPAAKAPGDAASVKNADDAVRALENLGYNRLKIQDVVRDIALQLPEDQRTVENIIRQALRALN